MGKYKSRFKKKTPYEQLESNLRSPDDLELWSLRVNFHPNCASTVEHEVMMAAGRTVSR
jgi:hypothetical protein